MLLLRKNLVCKIVAMMLLCSVAFAIIPVSVAHAAGTAKILFTFDDGWADQYTNAKPILDSAGFVATAYVNRDTAGLTNMMTLGQMQSLYAAGWDIANHTTNHEEIGLQTDEASLAEAQTDYNDDRTWLNANGMTRASSHVAYPSGNYTQELMDMLINNNFLTARATDATDAGQENTPITTQDGYFHLPVIAISVGWPGDVQACEDHIDQAISNNATLIIMLHRVELQNDSIGMVTSIDQLTSLVNYVKNKGSQVSVMTISQWYAAQNLTARVKATPSAPILTYDDTANTVSGLTQIMEYELDGATSYTPYHSATFSTVDLSGNHTLKVRYAAVGIDNAGADTTITFTANTDTVTFNSNGGSSVSPIVADVNTKITAPTPPTRAGCTFVNWYQDQALTNVWDFNTNTVTSDITLYAKWSATVTFVSNGDSDVPSVVADVNTKISAPTTPSKTGYTFENWYQDQTLKNVWDFNTNTVTSDITLYGNWTINNYTVTYKDWDGTVLKTQNVDYGGSVAAPSDPTRTGYTFSNWSALANNVTSDMTITAQYTINTFTVKFVDYDGTTVLKQETVDYGTAATPPSNPTRARYDFIGWNVSYNNITADLTVTARYAIKTYTVTFEDYDGTTIEAQSVDDGGSATAPENPIRTGYNFSKWNGSFTNVTSDLTITAVYSINTYTVTFKDWNGAVLKTQYNVEYQGAATAPADPTRTGYTFTGWDKQYNNVLSDLTVNAKYTKNSYTVLFEDWDGTILKSQTVLPGGDATAPDDPIRTGYTFNGWDTSFTKVSDDLTVTAQYTAIKYTVTFVDSDGTTILKQYDVEYGDTAVPPQNPIHLGYTFQYWSPQNSFINIRKDTTFTAIFVANTYTVTFKGGLDGKTILRTQSNIYYNGNASAPEIPTITGYTGKWDKAYTKITSDLTVTAVYTKNKYTVTFKDWNGAILKSQDVDYGDSASAPPNPSRAGYTFTGWDRAFSNISSALTVTATYSASHTVTFKDWDGTILKSQSVADGGAATAPGNPTRTGYTFTGWDRAFSNISSDLTVTATYSANSHTVTFKDWDGTILKSQSVADGGAATAPAIPTRAGYSFAGWNVAFSNVTSDLTVTALYSKSTYTVTFNSQGGSAVASKSAEYNGLITAPSSPLRAGYVFGGWYKQAGCTSAWNFAADRVTANTTLYSKWTAAPKFTVTVQANSTTYGTVAGGGAYFNDNVTKATVTATPKAGYRFVRWLEGTTTVSTSNKYSILVAKAHTLKAEFSKIGVPVIKAVSAGKGQIKISWAAVAGAAGYEVYRSTTSNGTYTKVASPTTAYFTDTGLTKNKVYYYKVRVKCVAGSTVTYGAYSTVKSAKPLS